MDSGFGGYGGASVPRSSGSQQPQWLEKLEDLTDQFLRKSKRFLPFIARLCFVLTYIEDSSRMYIQWNDQANYMANQLKVARWFAILLVAYNMFGQLAASVLILLRKFTAAACGVLVTVIFAQTIEYQVYGDLHFLSRNFALLGGLVLLLVESWPQAHVTGASLPSLGDDKPKNIMQLVGRIMVVFMFLTLVRFEFTFVQLVYNMLGIPLVLLVALGYKTKVSALVLVFICVVINLVYNAFWFVPTSQPLHDYLKYDFFQLCSIIGSLLFIVALGAGGVSLDDQKKRW